MRDTLDRWGRQFRDRIGMMVARGILNLVDDSGEVQLVQITMLDGEVSDQVEHRQPYGFTSNTKGGGSTEAIVLAVGGQRGNAVAILVGDPASRLKGLQPGEVAMHDDQAQRIVILRDKILITTTKDIEVDGDNVALTATGNLTATVSGTAQISAPHVQLTSNDVQLGAAGGKKVALDGDSVVAGKVVASSSKVTAV